MTWVYFLATAALLVVAGVRLARDADALADRTGLGRTLVGTAVVAAVTSFPELVTGIGAVAVHAAPDIAAGGVLGSCVVNLLFVVMIDAVGPGLSKGRQPGHAVSVGFGVAMLAVAGIGLAGGSAMPRVGWIGLPSVVVVLLYAGALRACWRERWTALSGDLIPTRVTGSVRGATVGFVVSAAGVVGAGLLLPALAERIAAETGLGPTFVGSVFVGLTTSLPEFVVSIAALRFGSVDLALGNLLGSNLFNLLILALEDAAYLPGPLLESVAPAHLASVLTAILMNAALVVALGGRASRTRWVLPLTSLVLLAAAAAYPFLLHLWPATGR